MENKIVRHFKHFTNEVSTFWGKLHSMEHFSIIVDGQFQHSSLTTYT